jgi:hypothetical protein
MFGHLSLDARLTLRCSPHSLQHIRIHFSALLPPVLPPLSWLFSPLVFLPSIAFQSFLSLDATMLGSRRAVLWETELSACEAVERKCACSETVGKKRRRGEVAEESAKKCERYETRRYGRRWYQRGG